MRLAKLSELKTIYGLFSTRIDIFPHIRQDAVRRRIEAKQCIFEDGVAITFQQYKKRTRVGEVDIPAKSIMLHQIVSGNQFSGVGGRVFDRFFEDVVVPGGGDLYLAARSENAVACKFYERHGMKVAGKVSWSGGAIPGLVYHRTQRKRNMDSTARRRTTLADEQDACVEALFAHYRASGFPVYDLSPRERAERLAALMAFDHSTILKNGVIRQTMHAMSICWHFMPHMWQIQCGGMRTPMEVFMDDDLFRRAIAKRLAMGGYVTDGGIRKVLSNFSGTQRVSTFRPSAAASIYRELLPVKGGTTWDFSGGFGGRLLGAIACRRVKKYIATEPSTMTMEGLEAMASELIPLSGRRIDVELHRVGSEDFIPDRNSQDCILSSPPFFGWERYADEPSQSCIRFPGKREWLEGYLGKTLDNCRIGLKTTGKLAVNITGVGTYPELETDFLALAKRGGWKHTGTLQMELSRMLGTRKFKGLTPQECLYKREPIFIFTPR
jgi:hypothetical protein